MASTLELWILAMMNTRPQLISKQVLAGTAASVTFSSIPQQFTNLRLVISAKSDGTTAAGYDNASMQFNGVSSNNYNWSTWYALLGAGSISTASGTSQGSMQCAAIWNAHFGSAGRGIATIDIPNYADTNNLKGFTGVSTASDGGTVGVTQTYSGFLGGSNLAAVASATISMNTGNFIADSTFCLYGM